MYDLIIVGGGPAGLAATAYALRKRLTFLLITENLGGYVNLGMSLRGASEPEFITGQEIVASLKAQVEYADFAWRLDRVERIEQIEGGFEAHTLDDRHFQTRALLIATGASPRTLGIPGERRLLGHGVSFSASSHAPFFWNRPVAVVGRGLRVLRAAAELAQYARAVYMLFTAPTRLDTPMGRKLVTAEHVDILEGYTAREITGHEFVEGLLVQSPVGAVDELAVDGVVIAEGLIRRSELVATLVNCDAEGAIMVNTRCATSIPGIFAAGDVTNVFSEQVLIAIGEGVKAVLAAHEFLLKQEGRGSRRARKQGSGEARE